MSVLLELHSLVRWLVVAAALIALVWFALVWARRTSNPKADRALMSAFTGVFDVQVLLGIVYLVWSGIAGAGFPGYRIEHGATMLIAAVVAHLSMIWRKADAPLRARNNVIAIVVALILVFIGVARLPQGWLG